MSKPTLKLVSLNSYLLIFLKRMVKHCSVALNALIFTYRPIVPLNGISVTVTNE